MGVIRSDADKMGYMVGRKFTKSEGSQRPVQCILHYYCTWWLQTLAQGWVVQQAVILAIL